MPAPTYEQKLGLPESALPAIGGAQALPHDAFGMGGFGEELQKFGKAGIALNAKVKSAQEHTNVANATTEFLTNLDGLETRSTQDPDYQGAPGRFVDGRITLERDALEKIDDPLLRAKAQLEFRRASLSAFKRVSNKQFGNEADANTAALDAQEIPNLRDAAAAGSTTERQAVIDRMHGAIDGAAGAGWINDTNAQARKTRFAKLIENRDVMEAIRSDPEKALELLKDPQFAPTLDPVTRESYVGNAVVAKDERNIAALQQRARFKPEIASAELGRIISPTHADAIFVNGIIPQESGGNPRVVSSAGALGLTQVMPATARDVARRLGMNDVASLSDSALKARLLDDKDLNFKLGNTYWREMLTRYEGNVPLALSAYNAGPGRADQWKVKAEAQYGAGFTPAQLVSVIGIAETKNYVTSIYGRLGAGTAGAGISPAAIPRAATVVGGEVQAQINHADQVARSLASTAHRTDDISQIYKSGYGVDPAREQAYRQAQQAAIDRGDAEAAQRVRDLDEAKAMAPFHRSAWGMAPVALEAATSELEAGASRSPNVTSQQQRQLMAFRAVRDEIRNKRNTDPVSLGEVAGYYQPVAIDPSADFGSPQMLAALRERGRQGELAGRVYLGSSSPFKPEEILALKERWGNAGPAEQFKMLQTFGHAFPQRAYVDAVKSVIGSDSVAETVGRVARERPELARDILQGQALLATKEVGDKAALVRPALSAKLGGQMYPDPAMQDAVVNAALAVYAARRGTNGTLYDATDSGGIEKAVEEITGPIVKHNGLRTPITPGIPPARFRDALDRLTEQQVTMMGGAYGRNATPIAAGTIADNARLVPLQPGSSRYSVQMPTPDGRGAPVLTLEGAPLVFDMRQIVNTAPPASVTPYQRGRGQFRGGQYDRLKQDIEDATP